MLFRALLAALLGLTLLLVSPVSVHAQTWTQLTPATSPSARSDHAMAYNAARGRVVLFGGYSQSQGQLNDTWEWDGNNWFQRTSTTSPNARRGHAMVYDAGRQRIILFGGTGSSGRFNDTWEWDGNNWLQLMPVTRPRVRNAHAVAYDAARQRIVLFGGNNGANLNDTWEWDGSNWAQRSPAVSPSVRSECAMAYDAARQKTILFGGSNGPSNDSWWWNGNDWIPLSPATSPSARQDHAMAYDEVDQKIVLFGGYNGGGQLNDTWEWDGSNWVRRFVPGPASRYGHAMAYDVGRQGILLFGGYSQGSFDGTTWGYCRVCSAYSTFGTGCTGTAGVPTLIPNQLPRIGQPFSIIFSHLPPNSSGMLCTGISRDRWGSVTLPLDLSPYGYTGCSLYISGEAVHSIPDTGPFGAVVLGVFIENDPGLVGLQFFNQAAFMDSGANPGGYVFTNAGEGVIGR